MKRIFTLLFSLAPFVIVAQTSGNVSFEKRKAEIQQYWSRLRPVFSGNVFVVTPSVKAPFRAGAVNDAALKDGVNMVNFFRFLCGLPADVQLKPELTELAQHGSVLNAAWGRIEHKLPKPAGMTDDFYGKANQGIGSSNLHRGVSTISKSVLEWIENAGERNIELLGHRRWILYPGMLYTGFGFVTGYTSMYCFDNSRKDVEYQYVAFPSGAAFPVDFFGSSWAWSVSLNPAMYQMPIKTDITVTLTEVATGKKWNFGKDKNAGFFQVETSNFGIPICIIFRPQLIASYKGAYRVTINGLKNKTGASTAISYETTFFEMDLNAFDADFEYVLSKTIPRKVTVTKYKGFLKKVVVPSTIKGIPVTTIGKGCFTYAKSLPLCFQTH